MQSTQLVTNVNKCSYKTIIKRIYTNLHLYIYKKQVYYIILILVLSFLILLCYPLQYINWNFFFSFLSSTAFCDLIVNCFLFSIVFYPKTNGYDDIIFVIHSPQQQQQTLHRWKKNKKLFFMTDLSQVCVKSTFGWILLASFSYELNCITYLGSCHIM